MSESPAPIKCAVIGYGPAHSFGRQHGRWIQATPGLQWTAVCDRDPQRLALARDEFPELTVYSDYAEVLKDPAIDLVSIITPHHTHRDLAIRAARAGKHVVVEKAMCLNVAEADEMIAAARQHGVTLAISHLRRHDGNFRAIKEVIDRGELGEIYELELNACSYGPPVKGWYSQKALSGGALFYWGPHAVDWTLQLIPGAVIGVTGFFYKKVWHEVDVEDHARLHLRFANGANANLAFSRIDASGALRPRPGWRILGTKGALVDNGGGDVGGSLTRELDGPAGGTLSVVTTHDGREFATRDIACGPSLWKQFYADLAEHLRCGAPVPVSGEAGRRTIAVLAAAERSAHSGQTESVAHE